MKDIYELLNEIEFDEDEFEEMPVSEIEKSHVKKAVKQSIRRKKGFYGWKMKSAVAVAVAGLSLTALGFSFPAQASRIPIIGDIFAFVDHGGLYKDYKEFSTDVNMTEESNGVAITIDDAIFDGQTVSLTYSIETDHDLGENAYPESFLEIKGTNGASGNQQITKIDDTHYVGLITSSSLDPDQNDLKTANVEWNIDYFRNSDNEKEIKGNWNFTFSLDATDNKTQATNQSVKGNGVQVKIDKIMVSPMSFTVYFDQIVSEKIRNKWHGVDVDIEVKDDLGHTYSGQGNGGSGDAESYYMSWSKTFEKLDENAIKLIITPYVTYYEHTSENFGSVEITADGEEKTVAIPSKTGKGSEEFTLDDIVVELER